MNNIRGRALFAILLGLAIPLLGAPTEVLVGGTAPVPAPVGRRAPSSASNGDGFFVAWLDHRSGTDAIIGTRVTRDGRVLDPLGIRIPSPGKFAGAPQVAWDGDAYLVVWNAGDMFAARINTDGHVVMAPRVIAMNIAPSEGRSVASNGNVSVVVCGTRLLILDRNGNGVGQETLPVIALQSSGFTITATASRFLVAWRSNTGNAYRDDTIETVALDANGRIDGTPVTVGSGERPTIATDGTRFTIAWRRYTATGKWVLHSRTLNADLTGGDEHELLRTADIDAPSAVWRGNHYEIVASTRDYPQPADFKITSIELDSDGAPIRTNNFGMISWHGLREVGAATNGAEMLVTSVESLPDDPDLVMARLVRGSDVEATNLLSWSGNAHRNPSVASSPYGHFVAWVEDDGMYMTRLDTSGQSLDGRGVPLAFRQDGRVRVAFDGTNYVIAAHESHYITVDYISPSSGITIAEAVLPVGPELPEFAIAVSAEATYVAYADSRVRVVRIPHTTYQPDPVLDMSPEGMFVDHPAISWNGSQLLVGWNEQYSVPYTDPMPWIVSMRVHVARVTAGLTLLDPAPRVLAETDDYSFGFGPPAIASNGLDWLIVMERAGYGILASRMWDTGIFPYGAPVKVAEGAQPSVTWDGAQFVLAWKEGDDMQHERPLFAAAVSDAGPLVTTRRTLITSKAAGSAPAMWGATIAYTKYSFRPEHTGVERTFLRPHDVGAQRGRVVRR